MLRGVKELNIDHLEWHPGGSGEAALVLVSAEAALSKDFSERAKALIREQKLDRIVMNIFYMVRKVDARATSILEQAAGAARKACADSRFLDHMRNKPTLYRRTCNGGDGLAGLLDCSSYTANSGTLVEKNRLLDC